MRIDEFGIVFHLVSEKFFKQIKTNQNVFVPFMFFDGNKLCQPEPTKAEREKYIEVTLNGRIFQGVLPSPINQLVYHTRAEI